MALVSMAVYKVLSAQTSHPPMASDLTSTHGIKPPIHPWHQTYYPPWHQTSHLPMTSNLPSTHDIKPPIYLCHTSQLYLLHHPNYHPPVVLVWHFSILPAPLFHSAIASVWRPIVVFAPLIHGTCLDPHSYRCIWSDSTYDTYMALHSSICYTLTHPILHL